MWLTPVLMSAHQFGFIVFRRNKLVFSIAYALLHIRAGIYAGADLGLGFEKRSNQDAIQCDLIRDADTKNIRVSLHIRSCERPQAVHKASKKKYTSV